jgi:archaetidylinositol phosphate synthase
MAAGTDEWFAAWSRRHGDYAVARSAVVRTWLRLVWLSSKPVARFHPDAFSAAGVATAAASVFAKARAGAGLVVATAILDGVDGAVAHRRGRVAPAGAVVDTTADRVTDALFLLSLRRAGARRSFAAAAAVGTVALEAQRALSRRRGDPVDVVTPGERPFRVAYAALGLAVAPSMGAAVIAGTTAAGALRLHRAHRPR